MVVQLYGRKSSLNVLKVIWALEELQIPYHRTDAGLHFELNKDNSKYRELNPNGLVPTIDDSGFILWESNTIVRYLARKYQTLSGLELISQDPALQAEAEKWMDWASTAVSPPLSTIFWQLIRTAPENQDHKAVESSVVAVIPFWKVLDHHLEGKKYILGEAFSVADIPIGCLVYRWFNMKIDRPSLPNLEAYYTNLAKGSPIKPMS